MPLFTYFLVTSLLQLVEVPLCVYLRMYVLCMHGMLKVVLCMNTLHCTDVLYVGTYVFKCAHVHTCIFPTVCIDHMYVYIMSYVYVQ